jgi:glycosyltransferase involved in cell wall biosynthesis
MKLLVTLEFRFTRTPDGRIWTLTNHGRPFWDRYLRVFEGVKIVARAEHKDTVDHRYRPAVGPGIEFFEVPYYLGPWQYAQIRGRVRKAIRSAVAEDDAVLCRVGSRLASDLLPMLWNADRPYGLEVIGDPYQALAPGAIKHPLRPFFRYMFTRSLREECTRAAAVSYVTEHSLQRRYPAGKGLVVGVSDTDLQTAYFSAAPRVFTTYYSSTDLAVDDYAPRPKEYVTPIRPQLVFVGSLEQMYKGQDVLIRAISLLRRRNYPVELNIVGDGRHRLELEELARSLSLDGALRFSGELPSGAAVRSELDKATLMVLPSRTEGLPRVIIEAMARGLPCIASDVGGIPELLHRDDLVPPNDATALADKIEQVITDPFRLNLMSARNLDKAQQFRPEVLETKRTEFYTFLHDVTKVWLSSHRRTKSAVFTQKQESLTARRTAK